MRSHDRPPVVGTIDAAAHRRSLRLFITFDQVTCIVAVGVILGVNAWLYPSGYLLLLAAVVGLTLALLGLGRRPLAAGNVQRAVLWVAAANWTVSMVAPAVATFCLPVTVVAALLPSILAVPYVDSRTLRRVNAISICVSTVAVTLGSIQDFSGLSADLPRWVPSAVLIAFVPFISGLVVMVSGQNSGRLRRALVETRESRTRLAVATDEERRRIAGDLHDGAQQHMLAMALKAHGARRLVTTDPAAAERLLDELSRDLEHTMVELRKLAHGVYPAVLTDRGLKEALAELAVKAPVRCRIDVQDLPRYAPEVEASVYWCCVEALQNVSKHAGERATAHLTAAAGDADTLTFAVEDDGAGLAATSLPGRGLTNMADRIGALGGLLTVEPAAGGGLRVRGVVPTQPWGSVASCLPTRLRLLPPPCPAVAPGVLADPDQEGPVVGQQLGVGRKTGAVAR